MNGVVRAWHVRGWNEALVPEQHLRPLAAGYQGTGPAALK